jgi:hypothetical protein
VILLLKYNDTLTQVTRYFNSTPAGQIFFASAKQNTGQRPVPAFTVFLPVLLSNTNLGEHTKAV